MSEIIENDDKTKSEIKMIGRPTIKQMFGENEEGALSEEAYARLWSDINKTPKNRLLEELHSRYHRERDISPFKYLLKSKMYKPNDEDIRREVNDYLKTEAEKAERNISLTENESETGEWWTQIKSHLIDSWFRGKRPNNEKGRFALYKLSFALGLDWEEHCKLFSKVFRMKTYLRTPAEFCLTYCKKEKLSYAEAFDLYVQYCSQRIDSGTNGSGDYQATRAIGEDIFSLKKDEFLTSIIKNGNNYFIDSKTIRKNISSILRTDIGDRLINKNDMELIRGELSGVGYKLHDDEYDRKTKPGIPEPLRSEFYVSVESALIDSGKRRNNLQLRKLYIILRFWDIIPEENTSYENFSNQNRQSSFVEFIEDIDDYLRSMNLPMLYYSDDFDRGIILAAAYITVCGGWGEFSDSEKLSGLITAIVIGFNR